MAYQAVHAKRKNSEQAAPESTEWSLSFSSFLALIGKLPMNPKVWQSLSERFDVDLICNVKIRGANQGFVLGSEVLSAAAVMKIRLGVDIFCESDERQAAALAKRLHNTDEPMDEREPE